MKLLEGNLIARGLKVAIVAGRFNEFIVSKLVGGAKDALIRHEAKDEDITMMWVPGAYELPLAAQKLAKQGKYDAIICLGTVIKGSTPHFDFVCNEAAKGIAKVSLDHDLPIAFGVLTTNTIEQAIERAGTKMGNKGYEAAMTVIELSNLFKELK